MFKVLNNLQSKFEAEWQLSDQCVKQTGESRSERSNIRLYFDKWLVCLFKKKK